MASKFYLEGFLNYLKKLGVVNDDMFQKIHAKARGYAGGKGNNIDDEPTCFEKLALTDMRPSKLRDVPDSEIQSAWLRLNQWYGQAKKRNRAVEDFVNAGIFVSEEMEKRGINADKESDFYSDIENLKSIAKGVRGFNSFPKEVVVIQDFVGLVGSTAKGVKDPNDIDVLFRASKKESSFLIQADNIELPVRNAIDPDKCECLHFIDNPQGAHGDNIPIYDLVLRRKDQIKRQIVKSDVVDGSGPNNALVAFICDAPGQLEYELGVPICGVNEELLKEYYLDELGISIEDVYVSNAVPIYLEKNGLSRTPSIEEIEYWQDKIQKEIESINPSVVIALGEHAKLALGDMADFTLPKPDYLKKYGIKNTDLKETISKIKYELNKKISSNVEKVKIDLGCGNNKPKGWHGIDVNKDSKADTIHDLSNGIPFGDGTVNEVRANHFLEHVADKEKIMAEIHRVLVPGGKLSFEVPSTKGEGAVAHPGHKSLWNKASFWFWVNEELLDDRPRFEIEKLGERTDGECVYVEGVLVKPLIQKAALAPFRRFALPKPAMAGYTEAFSVDEIKDWASNRFPVAGSPKLNGFRAEIIGDGRKVEMWFEGQLGKNQIDKFPNVKETFSKIKEPFILDIDLAITSNGKRLSRPDLMKLNQDEPEFGPNEKVVVTGLFLPYLNDDIHDLPYGEMKKKLDEFGKKYSFDTVPVKWANSEDQLEPIGKWSYGFDMSEGAVFVSNEPGFYQLNGSSNEMAKIKKVIELKVIVLDKVRGKSGDYNYFGGILPSDGFYYENITELSGRKYINLGKSFNSKIPADIGDIITVKVLEIIPDDENKKLAWLGASVIDVDKARTQPYFVGQVVSMAARSGVLQVKKDEEILPSVALALIAMGHNILNQADTEGGETRGELAIRNWENNWIELLPKSGKGKFVYQHHWRGLSEEESKLDEKQLLETDHSVHGDLRLESKNALWGFSLFEGKTSDIKANGGSKLFALEPKESLRGGFKLEQPTEWLDIGKKPGGAVMKPGEAGSTSQAYSKFFALDSGTYELGVAKLHAYEIFLKGKKLNGRYIISRFPGREGIDVWQITKPVDQTPLAESRDLDSEIADQKSKGRKWIYWNLPGEKPRIIDVKNPGKIEKEIVINSMKISKSDSANIIKADDEKKVFYTIIYPFNRADAHGDIIRNPDVLENALHDYMVSSRKVKLNHEGKFTSDIIPVELWTAKQDHEWYGQKINEHDALGGFKVLDDKLWQEVKNGNINFVSMEGDGIVQKI